MTAPTGSGAVYVVTDGYQAGTVIDAATRGAAGRPGPPGPAGPQGPPGPQGGTAITELVKGNGITLTDAGQIIIEIDPVTTASYAGADPIYSAVAQQPTARLFYSLDLTDPNGFVQRFARGRIDVIVDVARQP